MKSLLLSSLLTLGAAQTACPSSYCILSNDNIRFGNDYENSVTTTGNFAQPWFYNSGTGSWGKLTYSSYPLDMAIGTGTSGSNWSGGTVVSMDSPTDSDTDYTDYTVRTESSGYSYGHGTIVSHRDFTVNGQAITVRNTYTLGEDAAFIRSISRITNNDANTLTNVHMWVGTRDDYVMNNDGPTETKGNIVDGEFVAVNDVADASNVLKITDSNTETNILFYSLSEGVMTVHQYCCSFSNSYNQNPHGSDAFIERTGDGSYAIVNNFGDIASGEYAELVWYYAVGSIEELTELIEEVEEQAEEDEVAFTECHTTQIANSDHASEGSIAGTGGQNMTVICDSGYTGGGFIKCDAETQWFLNSDMQNATCVDEEGCADNQCTAAGDGSATCVDNAPPNTGYECVCGGGFSFDGAACSTQSGSSANSGGILAFSAASHVETPLVVLLAAATLLMV